MLKHNKKIKVVIELRLEIALLRLYVLLSEFYANHKIQICLQRILSVC